MSRLLLLLTLGVSTPALAQHEGHGEPAKEAPVADPHAGHVMPSPTPPADPHAGHTMPAADPHAGHVMPAPPAATSGPAHAADAVYGAEAMAAAREAMRAEHGATRTGKVLIDRINTAWSMATTATHGMGRAGMAATSTSSG